MEILITFGFIVLLSSVLSEPIVLDGHNAKPHEFPFMVTIIRNSDHRHICGGTIITYLFVLTAAHCLYGKKLTDVYIAAGKHNISAEEPFEQLRFPDEYFIHERYDARNNNNDIGLIKVYEQFLFSYAIKPIDHLPIKDTTPAGRATAIGWGAVTKDNTDYPDVLKWVRVQILPQLTCMKQLQETNHLNENHFCSGSFKRMFSGCAADSGGPLVQGQKHGNKTIIGVISFGGNGCSDEYAPPIYTKISKYIDWIHEFTDPNSHDE